jgi:O-acetyl-ADP-ribose deacetylase (regulator of RNase III)
MFLDISDADGCDSISSFQVLETFLDNCLAEAEQRQLRTLALSPIGAGSLAIPEEVFLDVLVNCIEKGNLTHLEEVDVLFNEEKNERTIQVLLYLVPKNHQ